MRKKKMFSVIALLCILAALLMYFTGKTGNGLHDFFWIPLVLSAVFLFGATRVN